MKNKEKNNFLISNIELACLIFFMEASSLLALSSFSLSDELASCICCRHSCSILSSLSAESTRAAASLELFLRASSSDSSEAAAASEAVHLDKKDPQLKMKKPKSCGYEYHETKNKWIKMWKNVQNIITRY